MLVRRARARGHGLVQRDLNGLVFHVTQYAPVWSAPGATAYLILIGLNNDISLVFAIAGVVVAKTLPADPRLRSLGLPNRWFIAVAASVFCVVVEVGLNAVGQLVWDWRWWNARVPWLIVVFGYLTFFVVAFRVHGMASARRKALTVGSILAFDAASLVVFAGMLRWI